MSKRFRIVPYICEYATGKDRHVWKIEEYKGLKTGFLFKEEIWKEVEWHKDLELEYPDSKEREAIRRYHFFSSFPKWSYKTEELAEAYIDKHIKIRRGDERHKNTPPREYP